MAPACKRQLNWDYYREGTYLITLALADRRKPILGELVSDGLRGAPQDISAQIRLTPLGEHVRELWQTIGRFHPGVKPLACQVMPDHFHGIIWVQHRLEKPLGEVIRGFKIATTKISRELAANPEAPSIWERGFHDRILAHATAISRAKHYLEDNPRRLAIKRFVRHYFTQHQSLFLTLSPSVGGGSLAGNFCALGNTFLLESPHFYQIQVSRKDFRYKPAQVKGGPREVEFASSEFEAKRAALIRAAEEGSVLVSPFISHGEQALCRFAVSQGYPVIQLRNQCLPPLFKPGGQLFDLCASGNYLLLSPIAWPHTTAKKAMTREDALVLNRLAQAICGADAQEINYRGVKIASIDKLAQAALQQP